MKIKSQTNLMMAVGMPLLSITLLTACNQSPSNTTQTSATASSSATTSTATATPKADTTSLRVAVTTSTPPFSFLDDKGNPQGIDIDMLNAIAASEGLKFSYQPTTWNGMFTQVANKTSDLAVSGISYTDERNAKYTLSKSYLFNPSAFIYKKTDISPKTLSDLKGLHVSILSGGKFETLSANFGASQITKADTPYLSFQSVMNGKTDVAVYDQLVWESLIANHQVKDVKLVAFEDKNEPMSQTVVMMNKDNPSLAAKINQGIDKLQASGKLAEIEKKWLSAPSQ